MATYTVRQGECLASIAHKFGIHDWRTIYDHPANAAFRRKRRNPNVVYPGDQIYVPPRENRNEVAATEQRHRFKLKRAKTLVRIVAEDDAGRPLADKPFELTVADHTYRGRTQGNGLIEQEITADSERGSLIVWLDEPDEGSAGGETADSGDDAAAEGDHCYTWTLALGHLDPEDTITGVQARLNNLGFPCGPVDGILGPKTGDALKAFQRHAGLVPSGQMDDETRRRLREAHDTIR